jgi:hypothetical protein
MFSFHVATLMSADVQQRLKTLQLQDLIPKEEAKKRQGRKNVPGNLSK